MVCYGVHDGAMKLSIVRSSSFCRLAYHVV